MQITNVFQLTLRRIDFSIASILRDITMDAFGLARIHQILFSLATIYTRSVQYQLYIVTFEQGF